MEMQTQQTQQVNGHENAEPAPNAMDFLGGIYLAKEDLNGEMVVRIVNVRAESLKGSPRRRLVVEFAKLEKDLVLNSTNTKRLAKIFSSTDTAQWRGTVTLYVDETVEYANRIVGGIRVKPAPQVHTLL